MNSLTDQQLLRDYIERRSEAAFTELVRRHVDLVYSAALRMVCDAHLAKDVAQGTFIALAQNASQLADRPVLSGWLHGTARNLAAKTVRSEVRRRAREQAAAAMKELLAAEPDLSRRSGTEADAWEHLAPHLDDALGELNEADRDALLLRYFENKNLREVGSNLGTSDDAAQKRVSRAVERLREFFAKRGITVGASGLVAVISTHAVPASPAGLAAAISTAAVFAGTVTTSAMAAQAAATTMNWINLKSITAIVAAAVAAGSGTYFVQQHETSRLREENQTLVVQQSKLTEERDAAKSDAAAKNSQLEVLQSDKQELLRLRGEVGALRRQAQDSEKLRRQNSELQKLLAQAKQASPDAEETEANPGRQAAIAKMSDARLLVLGLLRYASDHQDQLPTHLDQGSNYWAKADVLLLTRTNQFDLVIQGSRSQSNIPNPSATIAVREREPSFLNGKWVKAYGFADGHSELKSEPPEGFEAWEKERIVPLPSGP